MLGGGSLDRRGDALCRRDADRTGQEVEFAGDDGNPPAEDAALAGQH